MTTEPPDLTSVIQAFAGYVRATLELDATEAARQRERAYRKAHAHRRPLVANGELHSADYHRTFLLLVSDIFMELAHMHPDDTGWINFCLAQSEKLANASVLANTHSYESRPRNRQASSRRSAARSGVGKNYSGPATDSPQTSSPRRNAPLSDAQAAQRVAAARAPRLSRAARAAMLAG